MDKVTGIFTAIGYLSSAYLMGYPLEYFTRQLSKVTDFFEGPYVDFLNRSQDWAAYNAADAESRRT